MKPQGLPRLTPFLTLALLLLTACHFQLTALETTREPVEPTGTAVQPLEADFDVPAAEPIRDVSQATPIVEALPHTLKMVPEGWQGFYNDAHGYSLGYPTVWAVSEELRYSHVFVEIQKEPAGMGPPVRLYVSVFPNDYTDQDGGVYNFITSESIRAFMALPVGASRLKELDAMPPGAFLYTRLPDRNLAEWTALVIENSQVWEAPSGTKDRLVILVTEDTTYMLGMYYETPQQLAMFEQVLDTFQPLR